MGFGFTLENAGGGIQVDATYSNFVAYKHIDVHNPPYDPGVDNRSPWTAYLVEKRGNLARVLVSVPPSTVRFMDTPFMVSRSTQNYLCTYETYTYANSVPDVTGYDYVEGFFTTVLPPEETASQLTDTNWTIDFEAYIFVPASFAPTPSSDYGIQVLDDQGAVTFDSRLAYARLETVKRFSPPTTRNDGDVHEYGIPIAYPWMLTGAIESYFIEDYDSYYYPSLGVKLDGVGGLKAKHQTGGNDGTIRQHQWIYVPLFADPVFGM